ncbi:Bestrophin, RFP-TM, chloride channel-domain-containing protein [Phycomyces nitens]|nr:Bestrophin, RFP-TM, chloride channel-domain-containing protein [Phycomyces nitens]
MFPREKKTLDYVWEYILDQCSWPEVLRWKGSVLVPTLPGVFGMTLFACLICICHVQLNFFISIPVSVLGTVSVALGLLLAFRVNTAYDRYWEGRKLVQTVIATIRNLTRQVWINIPEETDQDHREKMRCIKLILAFMVATKHHLRHEYGIDYYDLEVLLPPNWTPCSVNHAHDTNEPVKKTVKDLNLTPFAKRALAKAGALPFVISLHNSVKPPNHDEPMEADDPIDIMNARRSELVERFPEAGLEEISCADLKLAAAGKGRELTLQEQDFNRSGRLVINRDEESQLEGRHDEDEGHDDSSVVPDSDQHTVRASSSNEDVHEGRHKHHFSNLRRRLKPKRMFSSPEDLPYHGDSDISLPIEILFKIALYINQAKAAEKIESSFVAVTTSSLDTLTNSLTAFERIVHTPIPKAYNIHLKQGVLLYIFFLPFALVESIGWLAAPVVALVSFTLFGIEAIGAEIENPFGYDENDLPLNRYCEDLKKEVEYIIYHIPSKSSSILLDGR